MAATKIKSIDDLQQLSQKLAEQNSHIKAKVLICMTGCRALGAQDVSRAVQVKLAEQKLDDEIKVVETGCIGMCAIAPLVLIEPQGFLYGHVKATDADEIVQQTLVNGKPIERLIVKENGQDKAAIDEVGFYQKQKRLVLQNCGRIDPKRIEDAIEHGAYQAAVNTIMQKTPETVIDEMIQSGLRGRGGAGFPAGVKWKYCRNSPGKEKYLICNADEGDPGAFMDRALLEGDPHRIIEGMIIAAYAIGATQGFIYVRAEYPIAVEHIHIALEQAREFGLLGENIAGSRFDFDIMVRMGAGAFVCGEETALIESLEGERGMPNPRPPFPAQSGYKGHPTNINNVETFANVPVVMQKGWQKYSSIGTEKSKGTKIFALAGKVNYTGLVEVPMGTTLREIVYDIGGGIPDGKKFKAAQIGGPSGGCIPEQYLDQQIDYDSVQLIGAIMGSGGLIVMDEDTCMVDVARYFLDFVQDESCGKCTPCRIGTREMLDILNNICKGNAQTGDLHRLEHLAENIQTASLCGLGQTAPNPVLSTIKNFREEYIEHIHQRKCRAGVCKDLLSYEITDKCVGCGACLRACPVNAIIGERKERHVIEQHICIKCGMCYKVCKFDAVRR